MIKIEEEYTFLSVDKKILESNLIIERNIEKYSSDDRGFLSQNVLSQLRTFLEYISLKIYLEYNNNGEKIIYNDKTVSTAMNFIKGKGNLKFIERFHYYLQITRSHYIENDDGAERLMLKYCKYLIYLKQLLHQKYNIEILSNINKFPVNIDKTFSDYYEKISKILNEIPINGDDILDRNKYYIQKIKTFFINGKVYYEITLTVASDRSNKFDRMIAFTRINIMDNYSIKIAIKSAIINIFEQETEINIITNWNVAIRACEIRNFCKIIGLDKRKYNAHDREYFKLMEIMTNEQFNLYDLAKLNDSSYLDIKSQVNKITSVSTIFDMLDFCRDMFKKNLNGSNILKYLLYNLNNKIIKDQTSQEECNKLSNLYLKWECIPFDEMPYASSLKNHNPKITDLFEIINPIGREHELLSACIKNNIEVNNRLYISIDELKQFDNINAIAKKFNDNLYYKHQKTRSLVIENNYMYINGYETDTISIINKLKELTSLGIVGYKNSFQYFIDNKNYEIDDMEKKKILMEMYENSTVSLVYGAAGTGKSTLIKHLTNFYDGTTKLCLANTNPAVENLKRNVKSNNTDFMTIHSFLSEYTLETDYDILIIDECSTVSNSDMSKILTKCNFNLLLLTGDIYQIESISFGNWFSIAKKLIPSKAVHELSFTWRSNEKKLLDLWNMVRCGDDRLDEMLTKSEFSNPIDDTILSKIDEDEIILCLNYDGLYGINNINNYMQSKNANKCIIINLNKYKIDDPIIFGDTTRFLPIIYNNMKGNIKNIEEDANKIWFTIEINKSINQLEISHLDLELIESGSNKSLVKFYVDKYRNVDDDDDQSSTWIIPFSVAYAVSIHKSQGLEYDSVKILLTNEIDDLVTHNIFYTAITRARKNLKIYWMPECQNKIISTIKHIENNRDVSIIKNKLN